ncbi:hypothetical protein [Fusobacterium necrophorum]|uniref:hypothetical protein n=1 Tax=Fusobacterium necrophorum TaxID=859 RepID=UPI0030B217D5
MSSVTMGGANRELTDKELSGGIVADGIGASIASIFVFYQRHLQSKYRNYYHD